MTSNSLMTIHHVTTSDKRLTFLPFPTELKVRIHRDKESIFLLMVINKSRTVLVGLDGHLFHHNARVETDLIFEKK